MLTSSIVARISRNVKDMQTVEILSYIDEVQTLMLSKRLNQRRLFDSSTGRDFQLTTTAGEYEYELASSNSYWAGSDVAYIEKVFRDWGEFGEYDSSDTSSETPFEIVDGTTAKCALVRFRSDPGTSTYYVTAYKKPTSITSISVQLEIPERYHTDYVIEGVMGMIDQAENGASTIYTNFLNKLDAFYQDMNRSRRNGLFGLRAKSRGY